MQFLNLLTQALVFILTFIVLFLISRALKYAFEKLNYSILRRKKIIFFCAGGIACWLAIISMLSSTGFFRDFTAFPPKIFLAAIPSLLLICILLFSKSFSPVLNQLPPQWLIYVQSIRIPLNLILWLGYIADFIPFQMTFFGFNYDFIVGITAILGGYTFFRKGRIRKFEAIIWNISGIILLLNMTIISALSTPSSFQVFTNQPTNTFVAELPFIFIPLFLVPFSITVHLFSIKQIWYLKK